MKTRLSIRILFPVSTALLGVLTSRTQAATLTVSNHNDSGKGSLRQAIADANATAAADTITFIPRLKGTITLTTGELLISSDISLVGPGANNLTLSGGNTSRLLLVTKGNVSLSGLTLANGRVQGKAGIFVQATGEDGCGGAIVNQGHLTITKCLLSNNTAQGGAGGPGADAYKYEGAPSTGGPGGTARGGAIFNRGTLQIIGTQFKNNTAQGGSGGRGGHYELSFASAPGGAGGNAYGGAIYGLDFSGEKNTFLGNQAIGGTGGQNGPWGSPGAPGQGSGNDVYADADTDAPVPQAQNASFSGIVGFPFQAQLPAVGELLTTYSLVSGELPPGLSLDPQTGAITGTPTETVYRQQVKFQVGNVYGISSVRAGTVTFTIRAGEARSLVVTTLADTVNPTDNRTSLREAVYYAHTLSDSPVITFASGLKGSLALNGTLGFSHNLTIAGPQDNSIAIVGTPARSIFHVEKQTVNISNLTLTGGGTLVGGVGGAILNDATLNLSNCTLCYNSSHGGGGAIFNTSTGTATLRNCTVANNVALVSLDGSTPTTSGGGIYNKGKLFIDSSTIAGNYSRGDRSNSGLGGGIFNVGTLELKNSIVAGNSAFQGPDIFGRVQSGDYNCVQTPAGTILPGSHNITGKYPQLGPLQNNGGPTPTFALLAGSAAIDSGRTDLTSDQRGFSRPFGSNTDIGAFEFQPLPVISINSPSVKEGNSGTTALTFTLTLSKASPNQASVQVRALQGSAQVGSDYQPVRRTTVTFSPGMTEQTFTVQVVGDSLVEEDEQFQIILSSPLGATIGVASGTGTIINDDTSSGTNSASPSASTS